MVSLRFVLVLGLSLTTHQAFAGPTLGNHTTTEQSATNQTTYWLPQSQVAEKPWIEVQPPSKHNRRLKPNRVNSTHKKPRSIKSPKRIRTQSRPYFGLPVQSEDPMSRMFRWKKQLEQLSNNESIASTAIPKSRLSAAQLFIDNVAHLEFIRPIYVDKESVMFAPATEPPSEKAKQSIVRETANQSITSSGLVIHAQKRMLADCHIQSKGNSTMLVTSSLSTSQTGQRDPGFNRVTVVLEAKKPVSIAVRGTMPWKLRYCELQSLQDSESVTLHDNRHRRD